MADRPDCYACVHRREVLGSAHSRCEHPKIAAVALHPLVELAGMLGGMPPTNMAALGVTAVPHGIKRGWFAWPVNFDPTWLLTCDGFTPNDERETAA